jgi:hypothetical protein
VFSTELDTSLRELGLQTVNGPRWLLADTGAAWALGVQGFVMPSTLTLVCSAADGAQLEALLAEASLITLDRDPQLHFANEQQALDLAAAWRYHERILVDGQAIAVLPLEYVLLSYLSSGAQHEAALVGTYLHQRGFDYAVIENQLRMWPALEQAVVDVMKQVVPLSRRAARRRAIREAERKEMEWFTQKREPRDA